MTDWNYQRVKAPEEFPGYTFHGLCLEHHLVWWRNHGEVPKSGEVIHHINNDPTDNRIGNSVKLVKKLRSVS